MSVSVCLSNIIFSDGCCSSPILGNSSDSEPMILNSDPAQWISTFPFCSLILTVEFGSLRIISPKSFACTTISPGSLSSTFNFFSMLISRSDAAIVRIPFSLILKRMPFKMGMVVLAVTALETIFRAFTRTCWFAENFIVLPPLII